MRTSSWLWVAGTFCVAGACSDVGHEGPPSDGNAGGEGSDAAPSDAGAPGAGGAAPNSPVSSLPDLGLPSSLSREEATDLRWNARQGAVYSLDVRPVGGAWLAPCVASNLLGQFPSHFFDGRCPSAGGTDVREVEAFRLCSSLPTTGGAWDPATARCTEVAHSGGAHLELDTPTDAGAAMVLRWPWVPSAEYALHLELTDGSIIDNCWGAASLDQHTSLVFDGSCPDAETPAKDAIARVLLDAATGGHWELPAARRRASAKLPTDDVNSGALELEFPGFTNYALAASCGPSNQAALDFGEKGSIGADVACRIRPLHRPVTSSSAATRPATKRASWRIPARTATAGALTSCSPPRRAASRPPVRAAARS